jgi:hypothetical protein
MLSMQHPSDLPAFYRLRLRGTFEPFWSSWFDDMAVISDADGETTVAGWLADQSALYGLIARMRDLGLTLIAVTRDE